MCTSCKTNPPAFDIDVEAEVEKLQHNLATLQAMADAIPNMTQRDAHFATDLFKSYKERGSLTEKQWYWVDTLKSRVKGSEPIYGSFDPILVMFKFASTNGKLKAPKVRLMSKGGTFVQLNFKHDSKNIDVYIDGWQGHGYRKFAGWIKEDRIVPYRKDRMTDDVCNVIQDLALDPIGTAKAMAKLLGVCMYCAKRLSDDRSKTAGYGPICAQNYNLPWG